MHLGGARLKVAQRESISVYSQPTPSISLDVAANSAVTGDMTPEVKNARASQKQVADKPENKGSLSTANATVKSERGPRMITTPHQGKPRRIAMKLTHSGPLRSASHPVRGDASFYKNR